MYEEVLKALTELKLEVVTENGKQSFVLSFQKEFISGSSKEWRREFNEKLAHYLATSLKKPQQVECEPLRRLTDRCTELWGKMNQQATQVSRLGSELAVMRSFVPKKKRKELEKALEYVH